MKTGRKERYRARRENSLSLFVRTLDRMAIFMKAKILRVAKNTLPFLVVGLYITCCVDFFIHLNLCYSSPVSLLSMVFSVLFFVSCVLLLWVFRESSGVLWFSLIISALLATTMIGNWLLGSSMMIFSLLAYAPFYGLGFFTQQGGEEFTWLFAGILVLMFLYKLILLIILKSDFYNKRRWKANKTA